MVKNRLNKKLKDLYANILAIPIFNDLLYVQCNLIKAEKTNSKLKTVIINYSQHANIRRITSLVPTRTRTCETSRLAIFRAELGIFSLFSSAFVSKMIFIIDYCKIKISQLEYLN